MHFQASYTSQINFQLFYPLLDSLFTTLKIICALHSTLYVLALSAMQCNKKIFANQVVLIMCGQTLKSFKFLVKIGTLGHFGSNLGILERVKMTFFGGNY